MIIKCIKCKKEFEQKRSERTCGCKRRKKVIVYAHFEKYLRYISLFFQSPINQWYNEFISTELIAGNYSSISQYAKDY